jgi:hypothetical protein
MDILQTEDCKFLSDRWGDLQENNNLSPEEISKVWILRGAMYDEMTFVVSRNGQIGILGDLEFQPDFEPPAGLYETVAAFVATHPGAEFYATQGDHTYDGALAFRVFIPEKLVTGAFVERVVDGAFDRTFGIKERV